MCPQHADPYNCVPRVCGSTVAGLKAGQCFPGLKLAPENNSNVTARFAPAELVTQGFPENSAKWSFREEKKTTRKLVGCQLNETRALRGDLYKQLSLPRTAHAGLSIFPSCKYFCTLQIGTESSRLVDAAGFCWGFLTLTYFYGENYLARFRAQIKGFCRVILALKKYPWSWISICFNADFFFFPYTLTKKIIISTKVV